MQSTQKLSINSRRAFTLAEVLITMLVIGVVAAITLPILNNHIQKQETISKLKKVYSVLSQATESINNDCGGALASCLTTISNVDNDDTSRGEVVALYKNKLLIIKNCPGSTSGCFADTIYKYLDGSDWTDIGVGPWGDDARFILSDGIAVCFDWDGYASSLFRVHVDVNGAQLPNQFGKDLFDFYYEPNARVLKPLNDDDCSTSSYGMGCASKVLKEGEINYY